MMIDMQREAKRIYNQAARTGIENVMLTLDEWIATINQFHGLCAYCQEKPFEVLDHLVPVTAQGTLSHGNCVPACTPCNARKNDRILCDVGSSTSFSEKVEQVRDALRNGLHIQSQNTLEKRIISFTQPQLEWLEAEARRLGISLPELVRRLIDAARREK